MLDVVRFWIDIFAEMENKTKTGRQTMLAARRCQFLAPGDVEVSELGYPALRPCGKIHSKSNFRKQVGHMAPTFLVYLGGRHRQRLRV
jgi:hypothetical protein